MHPEEGTTFSGDRAPRLAECGVEEAARGRADELVGVSLIRAFIALRPVDQAWHQVVEGADLAPARLEMELAVALRKAFQEMGILERQGAIDPTNLGCQIHAGHAAAIKGVVQELAVRHGKTGVLGPDASCDL